MPQFRSHSPHVAHRGFMQQGHSELICIPELTKQRASMQAACVAAREPCLVMGHRGLGGWRPPRPLSTLDGPFASFLSNLSVKTGCALACSFGLRQILSKCRRPRLLAAPTFQLLKKFGSHWVCELAHPGNGTEVTSVRFYQQKVAKMKTVPVDLLLS